MTYTINSSYFLISLFFIYVLTMILLAKFRTQTYSLLQYVSLTTFGIYLLGVIHLTIFPIDVNINNAAWYNGIQPIPIILLDIKTFVLNIVMLIPFGIYFPLLSHKNNSVKKAALFGFLISLSIEVSQLIIRATLNAGRSADIDDLIANTLGSIIGYIIIMKLLKINLLKDILTKFSLVKTRATDKQATSL